MELVCIDADVEGKDSDGGLEEVHAYHRAAETVMVVRATRSAAATMPASSHPRHGACCDFTARPS